MQRTRTMTPTFFSELFSLGIFSMKIVAVLKLWTVKETFIIFEQIWSNISGYAENKSHYSICNLAELFPFVFFSLELVFTP